MYQKRLEIYIMNYQLFLQVSYTRGSSDTRKYEVAII
jgi:hypothetical protein